MKALTRRHEQISGLISCGMAKKEIATALGISQFTVENTLRSVYEKTELGKINELTGWWINQHYQLYINFPELKKEILSM